MKRIRLELTVLMFHFQVMLTDSPDGFLMSSGVWNQSENVVQQDKELFASSVW